ncbi:hypothetical protein [Paractinoplanes atraurantiacus]|uniref:hypothetical protein n=1 Tax=Paractinoplanes atraurantiacus TaxID=1036182 RepID=UPI000BE27E94|nr:hypothetical protein [Actinoplanes atraurantiacus]
MKRLMPGAFTARQAAGSPVLSVTGGAEPAKRPRASVASSTVSSCHATRARARLSNVAAGVVIGGSTVRQIGMTPRSG